MQFLFKRKEISSNNREHVPDSHIRAIHSLQQLMNDLDAKEQQFIKLVEMHINKAQEFKQKKLLDSASFQIQRSILYEERLKILRNQMLACQQSLLRLEQSVTTKAMCEELSICATELQKSIRDNEVHDILDQLDAHEDASELVSNISAETLSLHDVEERVRLLPSLSPRNQIKTAQTLQMQMPCAPTHSLPPVAPPTSPRGGSPPNDLAILEEACSKASKLVIPQ